MFVVDSNLLTWSEILLISAWLNSPKKVPTSPITSAAAINSCLLCLNCAISVESKD